MHMKKIITIIVLVSALVVSASPARAAELFFPDKQGGGNVSISSQETHRNVYAAGGSVSVNGTTQGDLAVFGGNVDVGGSVEEDLGGAGGTVVIAGPVGGDVRLAGGSISIRGTIGGDILAAGGNITIGESSRIGGDALIAGGNVVVNAPVAGSARFAGGVVEINGAITGPVEVWADEKLVFGPNARVQQVTYHGRREAEVRQGAQIGNIDFQRTSEPKHRDAGPLIGTALIVQLLAMLIVSLLFLFAFPRRLQQFVAETYARPWASLGLGFALVILAPILAIVLFVTGVGYYLGLLVLVGYLLVLLLAVPLTSIYLGSLIMRLVRRREAFVVDWVAVVVGVLAGAILTFIPVVGWVALLVLFLMALGAMLLGWRDRYAAERA